MKLTLSHLSKKFGDVCALQDVSIEMEAGIYGILGPNGAGKSTLMNILTGNLKQDSGEIFYDGENKDLMKKKYRELLGYMPQQQICYPDMTLYEFLNYMSLLKEVDAGRAKVQIAELLDLLNRKSHAEDFFWRDEASGNLGAGTPGRSENINP